MTLKEKREFFGAALRQTQKAVEDHIVQLRLKHRGLTFEKAWSMLHQSNPELFSELDRAGAALSEPQVDVSKQPSAKGVLESLLQVPKKVHGVVYLPRRPK